VCSEKRKLKDSEGTTRRIVRYWSVTGFDALVKYIPSISH